MKRFVLFLLVVFFYNTLTAQNKIDAFKLINDVCEKNLSISEFKEQYIDYFTKDQDPNKIDLGMFTLENISFAGYESNGMVLIDPKSKMKVIGIMPNHEILDSSSRYQAAEKCHEYIIDVLGNPNREENALINNPIVKQVTGDIKIKEGKTYLWTNNTNIPYGSIWYKTDKEDFYFLMVMTLTSPFSTDTPIQRQFFKTLEFGKYITKQQIATALEVSSYDIDEERNSSGRTYNYWKSVYFGGIEWSFIEITTVESLLSSIRFTHSHTKNNQSIFDSLFRALSEKYGNPTIEDNEACWIDDLTAIVLTYKYGESKGGEMRHYVNLEYTDMQLNEKAYNIITNEL